MDSALQWHSLSEKALDLGLDDQGYASSVYIAPVWEHIANITLQWPDLSSEMIRSALRVLGRFFQRWSC